MDPFAASLLSSLAAATASSAPKHCTETETETGDRRQETGDRRQETGDRRQETGDRRQEIGDRRQETETCNSLESVCSKPGDQVATADAAPHAWLR